MTSRWPVVFCWIALYVASWGALYAVFFALVTLPATAQQQEPSKQYTVEAIYAPSAESVRQPAQMQWSPDGTKLAYIQYGATGEQESLYYFDPASGKSTELIAADKLAALTSSAGKLNERQRENRVRYGVADYQWAPDSQSLLFDASGQLWSFDVATSKARRLTRAKQPLSDPKFSPDGKFLSYLQSHNLYVLPLAGGPEIALTKDGDPDLLNGEVDWLYSEELEARSNYFWSPDARQILYLQMNEAAVPRYPIVDWLPTQPQTDQERYPKAGDHNPTVKLMVAGLHASAKEIVLGVKGDFYLPRLGWVRPGLAWAMVLNRPQNEQDLYFIDVSTGSSRRVLRETDPNYIELHDPVGRDEHQSLRFLDSSGEFLWLSWRDGFTHVYLYKFDTERPLASDAKLERQLESGDYEVSNVLGVNEAQGIVYLEANKGDDRQEQLFAVPLAGGQAQSVTTQPGVHTVSMTANTGFFADTYSSLTTPPRVRTCAVDRAMP